MISTQFTDRIFSISSAREFEELALEVFRFQYEQVATYREFCEHLRVLPDKVRALTDIPFLPIELFKSRSVKTAEASVQTFSSSGTTGTTPSLHHVVDMSLYERSFSQGFKALIDVVGVGIFSFKTLC